MSLQAGTYQILIFLTTVEALPSLLPVHLPGSVPISLFGCECHLASLPTWFPRPRKGHALMQRDAIAATTVERKAHGMGHALFFFFFFFNVRNCVQVIHFSILLGHFPLSDKWWFAFDSLRVQFSSQIGLSFMPSTGLHGHPWSNISASRQCLFSDNQRNSVHSLKEKVRCNYRSWHLQGSVWKSPRVALKYADFICNFPLIKLI